jgi:hypothetical protein
MNREEAIAKLEWGLSELEIPVDAEQQIKQLETDEMKIWNRVNDDWDELSEAERHAKVAKFRKKTAPYRTKVRQLKKKLDKQRRRDLIWKVTHELWQCGYWNDDFDLSLTQSSYGLTVDVNEDAEEKIPAMKANLEWLKSDKFELQKPQIERAQELYDRRHRF